MYRIKVRTALPQREFWSRDRCLPPHCKQHGDSELYVSFLDKQYVKPRASLDLNVIRWSGWKSYTVGILNFTGKQQRAGLASCQDDLLAVIG